MMSSGSMAAFAAAAELPDDDRDDPEMTPIAGYVVEDQTYHTIYRGRVYSRPGDAEAVRRGIVWHSRERYKVRAVVLTDLPSPVSPPVPPPGR